MTQSIEARICDLLEVHYGLKGVELVNKVMSYDLNITYNEVMDQIFDMIESGRITEIEMVFPNHTSKSFLVLKGTMINVIKK